MIVLARNATWSGLFAAVRAATGLLVALMAVKLLGGQRYGQLATLLSLFVFYLSLNSSVFTVLVTRLTGAPAADHANRNQDAISAATILAAGSIIALGVLTILLSNQAPDIAFLATHDDGSAIEIRRTILAICVLTSFQIMSALHSAIIEGAGRLDLAMKWQLFGPVVVTTTLLSLLTMHVPVGLLEYAILLDVGALIDLCLLVLISRKLASSPLSLRLSPRKWVQMWDLLKSGATLQAASLMTLFLEPLNKFLLSHYAGPLAVTAYDLAMKIVWGIQSLFAAAMRVFLHMSGEHGHVVGQAFSRALTLVLVPVLAAHVGAAIFLTWIVHEWIVTVDARQVMIFFGIATISNLGMIYVTPPYISLIGRGDLRFILRSQTIVAVANVVVSIVLIPQFGLLGAAIGLLCATAYNVVAIYLRHERIVGESGGLISIVRGRAGRYAITALLFASAIVIGAEPDVSYLAEAAIVLAIIVILSGEPLVRTLWERILRSK